MQIELKTIPIRELYAGYKDDAEEGVVAFNGALNVRPKYQREFVYKDRERNAVIKTVRQGFPLNSMYWMDNKDSSYELLDGQQRTISICQYINGDFSVDGKYYHSLTQEEKNQILNYKLMIYWCQGTDRERLDWFRVINTVGEKLTEQELRNAVYTGPWLSDAKLKFSKTGCVASHLATDGGSLLKGSPIRQEYLETVLEWIAGTPEGYMAAHQHDQNANELWGYFENVIKWVRRIFPNYRKEMQGVNWGELFNQYGDAPFVVGDLEAEVTRLMQDEDVTKKTGIYPYVITRQEKHLSIRAFTPNMKREAYERQGGVCPACGQHFLIEEMEADHVTPWHEGGRTTAENCKMLCKSCNRTKSGK